MGLRSPIDPNQLRQRLTETTEAGETSVRRAQESIGVDPEMGREKRKAKGIRVAGQIIGKKELAESNRMFARVADDLIRQSGITNAQEVAAKRRELQKRFDSIQLLALQSGLKLDQSIKTAGIKQAEKFALFNAISGSAYNVGQSIAYMGFNSQPTGQQLQTSNAGGGAPQAGAGAPSGPNRMMPPGSF